MPSRPTKGLIALNADGDRVDDARRRLLADWCRLVGSRVQGDGAELAVPDPPMARRLRPAEPMPMTSDAGKAILPRLGRAGATVRRSPSASETRVTPALPTAVADLNLPPRMSQVLVGLLAGAAEKQIARELSLSPPHRSCLR